MNESSTASRTTRLPPPPMWLMVLVCAAYAAACAQLRRITELPLTPLVSACALAGLFVLVPVVGYAHSKRRHRRRVFLAA